MPSAVWTSRKNCSKKKSVTSILLTIGKCIKVALLGRCTISGQRGEVVVGWRVENLEAKMAPTVEHGPPGPIFYHSEVILWVLDRCQGSTRKSRIGRGAPAEVDAKVHRPAL